MIGTCPFRDVPSNAAGLCSCGYSSDSDTGHQTGWTGVVARIMHWLVTPTPEQTLTLDKTAAFLEEYSYQMGLGWKG